ncbi:MAG: helix-turn-helix domain-containing protein [Oscillospiraceae bacterium]|jgi:transcriptional regulator with XRE-family HTH domain|nr:helix-turn-helix domain-containing protein [Oscillospiraceae bacterium]MDE6997229.1 helix-turn-helix domain-containing protein [Oscillospiraceae bacterium]
MSLAENLQYLRAREGITQEQLAERLDVSRQSVSKWESSASYPEMDTILKLCDMFHVDMDSLLRGSVERTLSEDTAGYDRFMTSYARRTAGAITAIIAGAGAMILLYMWIGDLSAAVFLLDVAISAMVLMAGSMTEDNFRKQYPTIPDFYTEKQKRDFRRRYIWYISGGVGAILFGVVLLLLAFTVLPEQEPYESFMGALFVFIVAAATFFLVYGGMLEDKYNIPKYNWENNPTPEEKAKRRLTVTACAVIMIVVTAVYVGVGLALDKWEWAVFLYPVGGILCGAAAVILMPRWQED